MKDSMSALDLRAIASEFQSLLQSRVKKCYQPHYEQIVLRLNPKGSQSVDMVIVRGSRVYLSQRDRPMPVNPAVCNVIEEISCECEISRYRATRIRPSSSPDF